MDKPDQFRELWRMQKALNERIGVNTDGMSNDEKTKWVLNYCRAMSQEIAELTVEMQDPVMAVEHARLGKLIDRHAGLQAELDECMESWEALSEAAASGDSP